MGRGRQARVAAALTIGIAAAARARGHVRRASHVDPAREAFLEERRARMRAARAALTMPGDGGG